MRHQNIIGRIRLHRGRRVGQLPVGRRQCDAVHDTVGIRLCGKKDLVFSRKTFAHNNGGVRNRKRLVCRKDLHPQKATLRVMTHEILLARKLLDAPVQVRRKFVAVLHELLFLLIVQNRRIRRRRHVLAFALRRILQPHFGRDQYSLYCGGIVAHKTCRRENALRFVRIVRSGFGLRFGMRRITRILAAEFQQRLSVLFDHRFQRFLHVDTCLSFCVR